MRAIFADTWNSVNHVLLGVLGGFFPLINYIFIPYQVVEYAREEDDLLTDIAEYVVGLGLYYLLSRI